MFNLTRYLPATALTLCLAGTVAAAPADSAATEARNLWHQGIAAGYQQLAQKALTLDTNAKAYCESPSESSRQALDKAWLDGFLAWQQVRFVDFGPVEKDNRGWQFQFWPDAKNLVGRKAGYLLGSDTPLDGDTLSGHGVAVQGFPMVEYLLFDDTLNGTDRALPGARACELLTAVSGHIAATASDLSGEWQAFREAYTGNDLYTHTSIRAAMNALEVLEDRRLAAPHGTQRQWQTVPLPGRSLAQRPNSGGRTGIRSRTPEVFPAHLHRTDAGTRPVPAGSRHQRPDHGNSRALPRPGHPHGGSAQR